eukprot:Hpha_TRINITY_DN4952_c0_g1::TRINITY_DN4952_c0_g1_i1::g.51506::m.51506/K01485/codA; cytosine deaminase
MHRCGVLPANVLRASASRILFSDVLLPAGAAGAEERRADVQVAEGKVVAVAPPRTLTESGEVFRGGMLTPPLADPHCHLDATLLADKAPNVSGTLAEGVRNWATLGPALTADDVVLRSRKTLQAYKEWGCLRVRTHVDTANRVAAEALLGLRAEMPEEGMSIQVVAFPQEGVMRTSRQREQWEEIVRLGCDAVGGAPHLEPTYVQGRESVVAAFELAEATGVAVDFHCDETDDAGSMHLEEVCRQTALRGMGGKVVAGHCCALHSYSNSLAAKVISNVVKAGVQVVANPLDNAVLQGRYQGYPRVRGMTRVDELWDAGAMVGIGHDSVRDPWYPLGNANMVEAAYMAVHLGHLTTQAQLKRAFRTLYDDNHLPFGGTPRIAEGGQAQVLYWPCSNEIEVLRERPRPLVLC